MTKVRTKLMAATATVLLVGAAAGPAVAANTDDTSQASSHDLQQQLLQQRRQLEEQRRALAAQERRLKTLEALFKKQATARQYAPAENAAGDSRAVSYQIPGSGVANAHFAPASDAHLVPAVDRRETRGRAETAQQPVGEKPTKQQTRPNVPVVPEKGGVLTPKGSIVLEPSLQYEHSNTTRVATGGVNILDTILIGIFEATQADRDTFTAAVSARAGVTNRLELGVKVPYVYRNDSIINTVVSSGSAEARRNVEGHNLGDIELSGHYQLNSGVDNWPILVSNLRVKTTTGKGPYDVSRSSDGQENQLATGSGFWGIEPSVTALFPSDPVVFFGNLGYLWNIGTDINKTVGGNYIGHVNPGDAVRASVGMGIALNDKTSLALGYSHDYVFKTTSEIDGVQQNASSLNVGVLNLGANYKVSDWTQVNFTVGVGVTDDAPDISLLARVPIEIPGLF